MSGQHTDVESVPNAALGLRTRLAVANQRSCSVASTRRRVLQDEKQTRDARGRVVSLLEADIDSENTDEMNRE
jgi:hypothetical protein